MSRLNFRAKISRNCIYTKMSIFSAKIESKQGSLRSQNCHNYSKSQFFVQKFNFDKTLQHFYEFFTQIFFWQFFSWNQSCQQLKSPKPQHFHEFSPKTIDNFSREIKVEFLDKKLRFRTVKVKSWYWSKNTSVIGKLHIENPLSQ